MTIRVTIQRLVLASIGLSLTAAASAGTFRIELDYMVAGDHSHRPSTAVIDAVVRMFACEGHTLIVDVDDALPHYNELQRNPNNCTELFGYSGVNNSFGALRQTYFDRQNDNAWDYCIFAHNYEDEGCVDTSSSGLGELGGRYFIVTLGSFSGQTGTAFDQAATLAHEFGHVLGLSHCGNPDCDVIGDRSVILPSIMSYRYQLSGVKNVLTCNGMIPPQAIFREINYSHGRLCSLDENLLSETLGTRMAQVDWNCSGAISGTVAQDISNNRNGVGWCGVNGTRGIIGDENEWATVAGAARDRERAARPEKKRDVSCITFEEWMEVQDEVGARGGCPQPALTTESCPGGENIFVGNNIGLQFGLCALPYDEPFIAQAFAPNHSTYFLRPESYTVTGSRILNKPGVWLAPTGRATLR